MEKVGKSQIPSQIHHKIKISPIIAHNDDASNSPTDYFILAANHVFDDGGIIFLFMPSSAWYNLFVLN